MGKYFKYLYRVDKKGNPIPGSNIKTNKNPKGSYWRRLTPQSELCCLDIEGLEQVHNVPTKYYVKLNEQNKPISGTLRIYKTNPGEGYQQVIPIPCCEATEIELFATADEVSVGDTIKFAVLVTYANGAKIIVSLPLESDDPSVTINGNVGIAEDTGTATISVELGSLSDSIEITVS